MINKDFLKPVLLANLTAWPVAEWIMYAWLPQFDYRISFPWRVLIVSAIVTFIIALVSTSFPAGRARG